jgi:hypothetical protein
MCHKFYLVFSAIIFFLVSGLHLIRVINQVPATVSRTEIPMWVSYFGLAGSAFMLIWALWLIWDSRKKPE